MCGVSRLPGLAVSGGRRGVRRSAGPAERWVPATRRHRGRCGPCSVAYCPGAARPWSFSAEDERLPSLEQGLDFSWKQLNQVTFCPVKDSLVESFLFSGKLANCWEIHTSNVCYSGLVVQCVTTQTSLLILEIVNVLEFVPFFIANWI